MPSQPCLSVRFEAAKEAVMVGEGDPHAFLFEFRLHNEGPRQSRFIVRKATYVSADHEEISQDKWLTPYVIGDQDTVVRSGVFKRIALVFYTQSLKRIVAGDVLYLPVDFSDLAHRVTYGFLCETAEPIVFSALPSDIEEVEIRPDAKMLTRKLNKGVERLELLEDRLGISLDGVYAKARDFRTGFDVTVTGEARLRDLSGSRQCRINMTVYDRESRVLATVTTGVALSRELPIATFAMSTPILSELPERIRLHPSPGYGTLA